MSKNVQLEDHGVHQRGAASARLALELLVMEGIWDCTGPPEWRRGLDRTGCRHCEGQYDGLEKRHMWLERTDAMSVD